MFCIYSFYSAVGIDRFGDHSNIQRGHKVCVVLLPLFFISNNSHTSFSRSQGHSGTTNMEHGNPTYAELQKTKTFT